MSGLLRNGCPLSPEYEYGGIPSPIIQSEDGSFRFYPIPIPTEKSEIKYSDLVLYDNIKVSDFLNDLPLKSKKSDYCHFDPDIRRNYLNRRPKDWLCSFGQVKSAQSHLKNKQIAKGDIFLFFGWFMFAEVKNGKFQFTKNTLYPKGFHAIYGYLQIDEMYKPNIGDVPKWLDYHPHVNQKDEFEFNNLNNTIYVASESFDSQMCQNISGASILRFSNDLILTKKSQQCRTIWELPIEFHPDNGVQISYNPINRWSKENDKAILKSASKGQEFVIFDKGSFVEKWCTRLLTNYSLTD